MGDLFETLGQAGGLPGIALGIWLIGTIIVLKKVILPRLSKKQAFVIVLFTIVLSFVLICVVLMVAFPAPTTEKFTQIKTPPPKEFTVTTNPSFMNYKSINTSKIISIEEALKGKLVRLEIIYFLGPKDQLDSLKVFSKAFTVGKKEPINLPQDGTYYFRLKNPILDSNGNPKSVIVEVYDK